MKSKVILTMFSLMAEIERDLISERTKEGLRRARAAGNLANVASIYAFRGPR